MEDNDDVKQFGQVRPGLNETMLARAGRQADEIKINFFRVLKLCCASHKTETNYQILLHFINIYLLMIMFIVIILVINCCY